MCVTECTNLKCMLQVFSIDIKALFPQLLTSLS